jgi:hypothetical protein
MQNFYFSYPRDTYDIIIDIPNEPNKVNTFSQIDFQTPTKAATKGFSLLQQEDPICGEINIHF